MLSQRAFKSAFVTAKQNELYILEDIKPGSGNKEYSTLGCSCLVTIHE